ncbi:hypothetical protein [Ruminococcus flavefaciens]|uniref:hypothetical protein n=1 Tax=Ruminococcus flavefaciens TaxID=1265 RepID=UPI00048C9DE4|nr:hypothetical protein [Ruminococcus flavefaciens]
MCIEMFGNLNNSYDQKTPDVVEWGKQETTVRGKQEIKKLMHEDDKKLIAECLVTLKRVERIIGDLY